MYTQNTVRFTFYIQNTVKFTFYTQNTLMFAFLYVKHSHICFYTQNTVMFNLFIHKTRVRHHPPRHVVTGLPPGLIKNVLLVVMRPGAVMHDNRQLSPILRHLGFVSCDAPGGVTGLRQSAFVSCDNRRLSQACDNQRLSQLRQSAFVTADKPKLSQDPIPA